MDENIDDLTIQYEEDGILIIDELDKVILSRAGWCTIVYRYRQWNRGKEEYGDDKFSICRYRKLNGRYVKKSKFNISSVAQAKKLIDALSGWIDPSEKAAE
ncbi:hypothetical protein J7L01_02015 [bacterium]|nr:hypothetical protein [bacterium]